MLAAVPNSPSSAEITSPSDGSARIQSKLLHKPKERIIQPDLDLQEPRQDDADSDKTHTVNAAQANPLEYEPDPDAPSHGFLEEHPMSPSCKTLSADSAPKSSRPTTFTRPVSHRGNAALGFRFGKPPSKKPINSIQGRRKLGEARTKGSTEQDLHKPLEILPVNMAQVSVIQSPTHLPDILPMREDYGSLEHSTSLTPDILPLRNTPDAQPSASGLPEASFPHDHGVVTQLPIIRKPEMSTSSLLLPKCQPVESTTVEATVHGRTKVTKATGKSKGKTAKTSNNTGNHRIRDHHPLDQGQLLSMLLTRYQTEEGERELLQEVCDSRLIELEKVMDELKYTQNRFEEERQRADKQEGLLRKYLAKQSTIKQTIAKFQDTVRSLAKDHRELKQDSEHLRQGRDELRVQVVRREMEHESAKVAIEKEHRVDLLKQKLADQSRQLQEDWDLLCAERKRNENLQKELSCLCMKYDELTKDIVRHREQISEQICQSVTQRNAFQSKDTLFDQTLHTKLEDCMSLLQELKTAGAENASSRDLWQINTSLRGYAEQITKTVESTLSSSKASETRQHAFELDFRSQLRALSSDIKTQTLLTDQIMDLRDVKATIRERLHATEVALAGAHQNLLDTRQREQDLLQKIQNYESEAAILHQQSRDNPETVLKLQSLEAQIAHMKTEVTEAKGAAEGMAVQKQLMADQLDEQMRQTMRITEALTAAENAAEASKEEFMAYKAQATADCENVRKEILKIAKTEKMQLIHEHDNTVYQLRQTKEKALEHIKDLSQQLDTVKANKASDGSPSSRLRARIAELEIQTSTKDKLLKSAEESLRVTNELVKAKDIDICKLKEARSTDPRSHDPSTEQAMVSLNQELQNEIEQRRVKDHRIQELSLALDEAISIRDERQASSEKTLEDLNAVLRIFEENALPSQTLPGALERLSKAMNEIAGSKQPQESSRSTTAAHEDTPNPSNFTATAVNDHNQSRDFMPGKEFLNPRKRIRRGNDSGAIKTWNKEASQKPKELLTEETTTLTRSVMRRTSSRGGNILPLSHIQGQNPVSTSCESPLDLKKLFPETPKESQAKPRHLRPDPLQAIIHEATGNNGGPVRLGRRGSRTTNEFVQAATSPNAEASKVPNLEKGHTQDSDQAKCLAAHRTIDSDDARRCDFSLQNETAQPENLTLASTLKSKLPVSRTLFNRPGILKRPTKRDVATAGFDESSIAGKSDNKYKDSQRYGLKLDDSRLPHAARKTRKPQPKKSAQTKKMEQRFSQEP